MEAPPPRRVPTFRSPGNSALTTPAAAIPPTIWDVKTNTPRMGDRPPTRHRASVTWNVSLDAGNCRYKTLLLD
jgi:hypothetical protein